MSRIIATFLFVGYMRPFSGTWGSAAALPVFWALHVLGGPALVVFATIALFAAGLIATSEHIRHSANKDPSEVVIDEVVGQWITLWPVSIGAWAAGADVLALYPGWIAGFFLFRFFDIVKMGPVRRADRRGDALGVMLDDVWAGLFAAICVLALAAFSHLVLMR